MPNMGPPLPVELDLAVVQHHVSSFVRLDSTKPPFAIILDCTEALAICMASETDFWKMQTRTILSQNTTDTTSNRAFTSLKAAFPTWEDVRNAPPGAAPLLLNPHFGL